MKNIFLNLFLNLFVIASILAGESQSAINQGLSHIVGRHVVADLKGCKQCDYTDDIEEVLRSAAEAAGATVLHIYVHRFSPQGMTAVVVLSESHIAFHTWPEFNYVACDIFTCGSNALPEKGLEILIQYFKPDTINFQILSRGS